MWASTLCPFSSSTRNMAFGRGSTTVPSTSMTSSFGTLHCFLRTGLSCFDPCWPDMRTRPPEGAKEQVYPQTPDSAPSGQDLGAVLGDRDRVLEVSREGTV